MFIVVHWEKSVPNLRVHFIRCIPSDDMQDRLVTTGVIFEPGITLDDIVVYDDNVAALSDEVLYSSTRVDGLVSMRDSSNSSSSISSWLSCHGEGREKSDCERMAMAGRRDGER